MKRKLDVNDAPTVEVIPDDAETPSTSPFEQYNLDPRILQSLAKAGYTEPTLVQAKTIPHALEGKDILAQSKTGTGKTVAYVIPILQSIIRRNATSNTRSTSTLVLAPTRELSEQIHKVFVTFSASFSKEIRSINLTQRVSEAVLQALLSDSPDVVVSTPGRVQQFLADGRLSVDAISQLVIDEADDVLSLGYEDDMNTIAKALPRGVQTFLMSATLTTGVETLKTIFCRDPVEVRIEDKEEQGKGIEQYVVKCGEDEKFLLLFVIVKLRLIRGKAIVFVDDIDRSYRVKLFLEQFGIKSCVLNSELPINTRLHTVHEFNKGLYDILVAADDQEVLGGIAQKLEDAESDEETNEAEIKDATTDGTESSTKPPSKKSRSSKSRDYGVSRGIDFHLVSWVLNFDLPPTSKRYTHRIGRTGRAGSSGTAISFVIPRDQYKKHIPTSIPSCRHDEKVLAKIIERQAQKGHEVKDYDFNMNEVNSFRYRMNDALRAVTKVAVREARAKEIKMELIKSEKLRKHFEDNPDDLRHLRHDEESGKVRVQGHLRHVPDYLLPKKGRRGLGVSDVGYIGIRREEGDRDRRRGRKGSGKGRNFRGIKGKGRGKNDPLKSFKRQ